MVKLLRDFNEKMSFSINEIKMPTLEKYLSSKFATASVQSENLCKYCEKVVQKSLLQHYRYCQAKKDFEAKKDPVNKNIVVSTEKSDKKEIKSKK